MTRPARPRVAAGVLALCGVLSLAACTSGGGSGASTAAPSTRTVVQTETAPAPSGSFTPAPATSVAALPASGRLPRGEVDRSCPYLKAGLDSEPTSGPNVADLEGDRVGQVTVLTGLRPVGCRFYFAYSYGNTRHEAVADILPRTFASADDAHNALVLTARAGTEPISEPDVTPGVDGVAYRTRFFGPDGARDWAFAFAKGRVLVVVHTQQTDTSRNAVNLGRAIVAKF
ncbi:hypothetical protein [uncultured Jatrophihabitans sp.]|uniref:hypothetical protein n=1 Tax=uncultured Jatrophihabitans sp. TaxID=1610747 RepID=UPI0035CAA75D